MLSCRSDYPGLLAEGTVLRYQVWFQSGHGNGVPCLKAETSGRVVNTLMLVVGPVTGLGVMYYPVSIHCTLTTMYKTATNPPEQQSVPKRSVSGEAKQPGTHLFDAF